MFLNRSRLLLFGVKTLHEFLIAVISAHRRLVTLIMSGKRPFATPKGRTWTSAIKVVMVIVIIGLGRGLTLVVANGFRGGIGRM